ncbi:transposase [Nocardiopsis gilva YIM 90087]|uniref:Transposase n=1 Tax=Nocardiopsis gilva YIM 90087 TaxID=1235441 RepID=A0A223S822_9ACTN|nr:RNA-guided endonuclease TnpB family protein [Nocardiopsis gilva]ASU84257.1 transposase [Nocardiopsis gilva YIM 90087]
MKHNRGHKARLYPEPEQAAQLEDQGHVARAVWNLLHDWWTMASENRRVSLKDADTAIRQARKEIGWLSVLPAQAAQQVLRTYFKAWRNCWEGRAEEPKFKTRFRSRMAIDVPQGEGLGVPRITRRWGIVKVPKVGAIRFRWTTDLPVGKRADADNKVTGARLVKEPDGWYVVFRVRTEVKEPSPHTGPGIGIDRGVNKPLALSDGSFREHGPWLGRAEAERLRRLEKKAARQKRARKSGGKTSNRLKRTYDQIAGVRARAKRRALDWQHKTTTALAETFGVVTVEDLDISNMTRSARGSVEAPGKHVRQKAGLNRAVASEAWGRTVTMLAYKLADRGGHLVKVPAANTSKRCHACRTITEGSRESRERFVCKNPGCGWAGDADTNAACNVAEDAKEQAPQDIAGARTWSPRGCPGDEASTISCGQVPSAESSHLRVGEDVNARCATPLQRSTGLSAGRRC